MVEERKYLVHPSYIVMTLVLFGITMLFIGFSGAYLYSRFQAELVPIQLPSLFYFNSLLLVASSFALVKAKQFYIDDRTKKYRNALAFTMALTILFLIAQIIAWMQLFNNNVFLTTGNMEAYMYVISGLHFAHVIAGIPFLAWFIVESVRKMKSPVSVLIYFSDPDKKRRLDLLTLYWHYLDALWIYLVLFFLVNYFV